MNRRGLRFIGVFIAVVGFLAAGIIPPTFVSSWEGGIFHIPLSVVIKVAWSSVFFGAVCGIGIGLFIASFINLEPKNKKETEQSHGNIRQ